MSVNTKVNGQLVKSAGLYSVTAPIGMADIYSTEEKEVGLWKNNKPLYQKTLVIGNGDVSVNQGASPNFYAVVDTGISNLDEAFAVVDKSYMILASDNSPRNFSWIDYQGKGSSQFVAYSITSRTNVTVVLTIQYTKTTDTPWSGKFVPQGYGYVSSGDIYSFEERQVGVWADGKPLYQKTFDCGALPNNNTKFVQTGYLVSEITVVEIFGVAHNSNTNATLPIARAWSATGSSYVIDAIAIANNDDMAIRIGTLVDLSSYDKTYVTIQYTKTTDVAGSGEYVPSGDKAVHYSTEEEVIGTWIDGSTIYRKVFTFSTPITCPSQQWAQTDILTSSVDASVMVRAFTALGQSVYVCDVSCDTNETYVALLNLRPVPITIDTLILEYTKSS